MQNETKTCQNCTKDFVVEADDFAFYEKMGVPAPDTCPECRLVLQYLWRNERVLYRNTCGKSGESIVSIYSPDSPFTVYDIHEWWGDSWSAEDYAMEYDFSRPFFDQFKELMEKVPRLALLNKNCTNSDYSNHSSNSKNAYMCTTAFDCENVFHSQDCIALKNSADIYRSEGNGNENLYECMNVYDCYNCQYCFLIKNSFDCYYSFDLRNCSNCFLSYNLRGQSYVFRNQKYSKEEYFEKIKEFNLSSYADRQKAYTEWLEMIFEKALHRGMLLESAVGCTGNFIFEARNTHNSFDVGFIEDCKNIHFSLGLKDSMDSYHVGVNAELLYQNHAVTRSSNGRFVHLSYDNTNLTYCESCHNSNELFGCAGVKKGSYMILNKKYSKEEYFEMKEKIIAHMKETGEWGHFFPPELSPFAYNETQAQVYFPLTKEEALANGFRWKDNLPGTFGKETLQPDDIPDCIEDVDESITKEILKCEKGGRNYTISAPELRFYKEHAIPLPRLHPDERYLQRIAIRPQRRLYDAVCAVSGVPIKTAYPPEHCPKNMVSDEVYQKEVL